MEGRGKKLETKKEGHLGFSGTWPMILATWMSLLFADRLAGWVVRCVCRCEQASGPAASYLNREMLPDNHFNVPADDDPETLIFLCCCRVFFTPGKSQH